MTSFDLTKCECGHPRARHRGEKQCGSCEVGGMGDHPRIQACGCKQFRESVSSPRSPEPATRFKDSDTGESTLDVVRVPEGFSLQMAYAKGAEPEGWPREYVSVILSPAQAQQVGDMLRGSGPRSEEKGAASEKCPICGASLDSIGVVILSRAAAWKEYPAVTIEDRFSKCGECGEEWYDPKQANRHTLALLDATLESTASALRATTERAEEKHAAHLADIDRLHKAWRDLAAAESRATLMEKERDALASLIEKHHDYGHYMRMKEFPASCPCCEQHGGEVLTPEGFWKWSAARSTPPSGAETPEPNLARELDTLLKDCGVTPRVIWPYPPAASSSGTPTPENEPK